MKINKEDVSWLQQIHNGLVIEAIPEFDRSRLVALELISEAPSGLIITERGQEAMARHDGSLRAFA